MFESTHKPEFDKCFIDADSILYRIAATTDSLTQAKGHFDTSLKAIMRDTDSVQGFVAVKGKGNFRFEIAEDYKGNRSSSDMDPKMKAMLDDLYQYAWDTDCFQSHNCEADDVVSIWATEALELENTFVIAHIDKDIDMIPGWHYNFNKKNLYYIEPDDAHLKLCKQMLTGDSADNIKGLKGVGEKTALKILDGVSADDALNVVIDQWRKKYPRDWKVHLEKCFNLLYMRRSWDDFRALTLEEVFGAP